MKRFLAVALVLGALFVSESAQAANTPFAQGGKFGLGLGGSNLANGISGKLYLANDFAVQANVGWWRGWGASIGADAIWEMPQLWTNGDLSLNWNLGAGAGLGFYNSTGINVAGVGGLGLQISKIPLELTAEIRPTFYLGNELWSGFWFSGGGAIRYFF